MKQERGKRLLLMVTLCCLVTEVAARVGLALLTTQYRRPLPILSPTSLTAAQRSQIQRFIDDSHPYLQIHPETGWITKSDAHTHLYSTDSDGYRHSTGPDFTPSCAGIAFGDSYTHGDDVSDEETWISLLNTSGVTHLRNAGVSGFGPDQALIRYRATPDSDFPESRKSAQNKLVILGVMSENIRRVVNVFRPFYQPHDRLVFSKPRFLPTGTIGKPTLLVNPLPTTSDYQRLLDAPATGLKQLGTNDWYYENSASLTGLFGSVALGLPSLVRASWNRYRTGPFTNSPNGKKVYNMQSNAGKTLLELLLMFDRQAKHRGHTPLILLFPYPYDIKRFSQTGQHRYSPLVEELKRHEIQFFDLVEAFKEHSDFRNRFFSDHAHYNNVGNQVVADALKGYLLAQGLCSEPSGLTGS